jgi:uncharacterized membrane protein
MALVASAAIILIAAILFYDRSSSGVSSIAAATPTSGQDVKIPLADLQDGTAKFFKTAANGVDVRFFAMKSSDGVYRAALDACIICYQHRKGYFQQGDAVTCRNCGKSFASNKINVLTGGCNPIPLSRNLDGDHLTVRFDDIRAGSSYF